MVAAAAATQAAACGLAFCVPLARADAAAAAKAAALAAAAASAAWVAAPTAAHIGARRPWAAKALEAAPAVGARSSGGGGGTCPLGYGLDVNPHLYKSYALSVRGICSTFDPWNVLKVFFKNLTLVGVINVNLWMWEVLEAEEQAATTGVPAEPPPFPDLEPVFNKAAASTGRELATVAVRRALERAAAARLPARAAWKLLKDFRASLNRKADFYLASRGRWWLLPRFARTIGRATLLMYLAELTVCAALAAVAAAEDARQDARAGMPASQARSRARARVFALRVARHAARCGAVWAASAVSAAAIAALLAPRGRAGQWGSLGHFASDVAFTNLFALLLDGGLGDVAAMLPPGLFGGGGSAVEPPPPPPPPPHLQGGGGSAAAAVPPPWQPPAHVLLPPGSEPAAL